MTTELTVAAFTEVVKLDIEKAIKHTMVMEQADCPVRHYFSDGVYIREVLFPAGIFVIGHIHKSPHMNVFVKGVLDMVGEDGSRTTLHAPMTFVGKAGRKIALIREEVIWQNIYPNPDNCKDVEVLEDRWLIQTPCFEEYKHQLNLLASPDNDYDQMLQDIGFTAELVAELSASPLFRCDMPEGWNSVAVRASTIHGRGLFAETNFAEGEMICPFTVGEDRTPAGVFTNHSGTPNAKVVKCIEGLALVATSDIYGRRGGFNGQEITVDYRQVRAAVEGD
jgi:hypothetical protein